MRFQSASHVPKGVTNNNILPFLDPSGYKSKRRVVYSTKRPAAAQSLGRRTFSYCIGFSQRANNKSFHEVVLKSSIRWCCVLLFAMPYAKPLRCRLWRRGQKSHSGPLSMRGLCCRCSSLLKSKGGKIGGRNGSRIAKQKGGSIGGRTCGKSKQRMGTANGRCKKRQKK